MATASGLRVSRFAFRVDGLRDNAAGAARMALWACAIVAAGIAISVPEQTLDVFLGTAALAAVVLSFIRPLVALPLLLLAVPFGGIARGSSGDTSSDLSFGAAELLVALLTLAWLARGIRSRELSVPAGGIVVAVPGMAILAPLSL